MSAVSLSGRRILIADDQGSIRDVISQALVDAGAQVTAVQEGGAAMAWLHADRFDAFLTDLQMPGIHGVALVEGAGEVDPMLPVLVVTGYAQGEQARGAIRAGAVRLLAKPFDLTELVAAVVEATLPMTVEPVGERITWWLEAEGVMRRRDREQLPEQIAALARVAWGAGDDSLPTAIVGSLAEARPPLRERATAESSSLTVWRSGETFPRLVRSRPEPRDSAAA